MGRRSTKARHPNCCGLARSNTVVVASKLTKNDCKYSHILSIVPLCRFAYFAIDVAVLSCLVKEFGELTVCSLLSHPLDIVHKRPVENVEDHKSDRESKPRSLVDPDGHLLGCHSRPTVSVCCFAVRLAVDLNRNVSVRLRIDRGPIHVGRRDDGQGLTASALLREGMYGEIVVEGISRYRGGRIGQRGAGV